MTMPMVSRQADSRAGIQYTHRLRLRNQGVGSFSSSASASNCVPAGDQGAEPVRLNALSQRGVGCGAAKSRQGMTSYMLCIQ